MTPQEQAFHACYAAYHKKHWGRYAARQYIQKLNTPGLEALYRLACQLNIMNMRGL